LQAAGCAAEQFMRAIFYGGAAWLVYVYAGYPLILAILARWQGVRLLVSSEEYLPSVSVLLAARNEEQDIGWKIDETLEWDYPRDQLEVLVASDASDDRTDEIVAGFGPRLTFIRMERRGGKVRALNRLAKIARGEILFFTDANAHIGRAALRLLVRHFTDARVGCVTGSSRSLHEGEGQRVAPTAGLYRRYESMLRRLESAIGSVLVCDGAIFCMRAAQYQPLSPELANDLETPMRMAAAGWQVIYEPQALVLERDSSSSLEELKRQRRMCAQGMAAMFALRGVFGGLRGWQFVSHKLLRWLSLIPMAAVLGSSAVLAGDSAFFAAALMLQAIFYGIGAIGLLMTVTGREVARVASVPFYVMLGLVAAQIGVIDALMGRRFDVWESPALSRGCPALRASITRNLKG
jgi:cellulose synthase/poly-beta-1,6-N-acetylglucosamine synthase-like glycosyltransferase